MNSVALREREKGERTASDLFHSVPEARAAATAEENPREISAGNASLTVRALAPFVQGSSDGDGDGGDRLRADA